ncbi:hypothetical protein HID58_084490 [Brassica napus]|uniref:Uncharacterized protein n=1 Tax=Brassica napus TaxID=3708 RepID=A0ABQ7XLE7_BRANA|nr:hypothetical protein HID58_084490 [Brassica napus]
MEIPRNLLPRGFLEHGTPVTPPMLEVEFAPEFLINLRVSDLFNLPGETVLMTPEISSKSILSECPYLLLEPHLKEQLLIHVTTHVGHLAVIKVLVAALTFISAKISDEERRRLNLYAVKDKNVYESLSIRPSIP